jgi:hypothetical protein
MKSNEITLENSFTTPTQLEIIRKIKAEQSPYYMNQWTNPHYIVSHKDGLPMYKRSELPPQHCLTLPSTEDLIQEVEEVLRTKGKKREKPSSATLPLSAAGGKGKRKEDHIPKPGDIKYPRSKEGSSTVERTVSPPKGYTFPGAGKGRRKSKVNMRNMGGRNNATPEPSNVPTLITSGPAIQFFWIQVLGYPGTEFCNLRTVDYKTPTINRLMHLPLHTSPSNTRLRPRVDGGIVIPQNRAGDIPTCIRVHETSNSIAL